MLAHQEALNRRAAWIGEAAPLQSRPAIEGVLLQSKRQQHIPRITDEPTVTRIHVKHTANNNRPRPIHAPTAGKHTINSLELFVSVKEPNNLPILLSVGPKPPVHSTVEHGARDGRKRTPLTSAAPLRITAEFLLR